MRTVSLDDNPRFTALSYTWSDPIWRGSDPPAAEACLKVMQTIYLLGSRTGEWHLYRNAFVESLTSEMRSKA
jgi:hypothetical protein